METFEVGDLVLDKLNEGGSSYGLGVVVSTGVLLGPEIRALRNPTTHADDDVPGKRYDVYFNKFERTITFHGDYLEKV
jgi:hypothetical protein